MTRMLRKPSKKKGLKTSRLKISWRKQKLHKKKIKRRVTFPENHKSIISKQINTLF